MSIAFDQSLILKIENAKTNMEVLSQMCEHLCERGIVKDTYCKAILEREESFPTGLNPPCGCESCKYGIIVCSSIKPDR